MKYLFPYAEQSIRAEEGGTYKEFLEAVRVVDATCYNGGVADCGPTVDYG